MNRTNFTFHKRPNYIHTCPDPLLLCPSPASIRSPSLSPLLVFHNSIGWNQLIIVIFNISKHILPIQNFLSFVVLQFPLLVTVCFLWINDPFLIIPLSNRTSCFRYYSNITCVQRQHDIIPSCCCSTYSQFSLFRYTRLSKTYDNSSIHFFCLNLSTIKHISFPFVITKNF